MTQNTSKYINGFNCEKCNFNCSKMGDFKRHNLTAKHKKMTNDAENTSKTIKAYHCDCGKKYKYRQGLYAHQLNCNDNNAENTNITENTNNNNNNENTNITENTNNLIFQLLAQNKELMNLITNKNEETKVLVETIKDQSVTIKDQSVAIKDIIPKIGTTNNTTNNNKFNLNIFLSEDCKDAINFSDFIKNIQVSPEDLENQAQMGYVNGITKVFIDNIKRLGVNKRPIHCTDKKRNTLYIKENDEWNKEGSQECVINGIQEITRRTHGTLIQLKEDNSIEYSDADSDFSNKCIDIQRNLTPVYPRETSFCKIMGNISDNTTIEENQKPRLI